MTFLDPPERQSHCGKERRVGVEIEFGGLEPEAAAHLVTETFGGQVVGGDRWNWQVEKTGLGQFTVALDAQFFERQADGDDLQAGDKYAAVLEDLKEEIREAAGVVGATVVPTEIVAPPIPYSKLARLDELIDALREADAAGTGRNPLFGFGLHLNPEVTGKDVADILPTLKAYLLCSDWLRAQIDVDLTRRLLPFVRPFPAAYVERVVAPDYTPDCEGLIGDYLKLNATRNRELDMLPCFAWLDEDRVRAAVDDPRIKARPTYHYRLPDVRLGDENWSIVKEWNRWVVVEQLAADKAALARLGELYLEPASHAEGGWLDQIMDFMGEWLKDR